MNPSNVPTHLGDLLPVAEVWGIGDDVERARAVERASLAELEQMVQEVDDAEDVGLYDWLAGDAADDNPPSEEYIAITCLTMAADAARLRLRREGSSAH